LCGTANADADVSGRVSVDSLAQALLS